MAAGTFTCVVQVRAGGRIVGEHVIALSAAILRSLGRA
jgi:hypothetical protein